MEILLFTYLKKNNLWKTGENLNNFSWVKVFLAKRRKKSLALHRTTRNFEQYFRTKSIYFKQVLIYNTLQLTS